MVRPNRCEDGEKMLILTSKSWCFYAGKHSLSWENRLFSMVFPETGLLVLEGECTEFPVFCWVLTIAKDGD